MNRQLQREAQRRRRELERQAKEMAKLSALEQARLEVETFENSLDVLLSVHREPCESWDWIAIASDLRSPAPRLQRQFELRARREALTDYPRGLSESRTAIEAARDADRRTFQSALDQHRKDAAQIETLRELAERVLDGEGMAFLEAFAQFNPVAEFSSAGSLKQFAVERRDLINCAFKVNFDSTIPNEIKTLTASGKVSVKPMPKARRHEVYQDYVSACSLRMAGEVLAMLPVNTIIVTALADTINYVDRVTEIPILTVVFDRFRFEKLDFETTSPAEAIDQFQHRCNFKVTRGSGQFQPVIPFTAGDVATPPDRRPGFDRLLELVRELHDEIRPASAGARATAGEDGEAE